MLYYLLVWLQSVWVNCKPDHPPGWLPRLAQIPIAWGVGFSLIYLCPEARGSESGNVRQFWKTFKISLFLRNEPQLAKQELHTTFCKKKGHFCYFIKEFQLIQGLSLLMQDDHWNLHTNSLTAFQNFCRIVWCFAEFWKKRRGGVF